MKKQKLLIVDDECDIRSLCKCVVERSFDQFDIHDAKSLSEAKEMLKTLKPDIVLLDLHLNDGFGFDLIPTLKKVNPDVKILIVTAYNQCEEKRKAVDLGAFGLLGKPFRSADLVDRINEMTSI